MTWQIDCPETSLSNYRHTLRNYPDERRAHILGGRSLKSLKLTFALFPITHPQFVSFSRDSTYAFFPLNYALFLIDSQVRLPSSPDIHYSLLASLKSVFTCWLPAFSLAKTCQTPTELSSRDHEVVWLLMAFTPFYVVLYFHPITLVFYSLYISKRTKTLHLRKFHSEKRKLSQILFL